MLVGNLLGSTLATPLESPRCVVLHFFEKHNRNHPYMCILPAPGEGGQTRGCKTGLHEAALPAPVEEARTQVVNGLMQGLCGGLCSFERQRGPRPVASLVPKKT